jgi:hypothetical protein
MAKVQTESCGFAYAIEDSLGSVGVTTTWKTLEPNDIGSWGAVPVKVARDPISNDRMERKGVNVDVDSTVEFAHDLTKAAFLDFIEGFAFVSALYPYGSGTTRIGVQRSGALFENLSAVNSTSSFDHDTLGVTLTAGLLVYTRGFTTSANNAMWEVDSGGSATSTVVTSAPTDETPGNTANATLEIAGVRGSSGDIDWTYTTKTLSSTTLDFTTLGLSAGQVIHIGGLTSTNQFAEGTGYGRIVSIAANAIVLDKVSGDLATANGTEAGKSIDLLFGAFIRNVATTDSSYSAKSYQFELTMPELGGAGVDRYQYAKGNYANQVTFNLPLAEKATIDFSFVGQDVEDIVSSQKTNADTPQTVVQDDAYNTTADLARIRLQESDETGLTTCFKSLSLSLNNQVSPEKCLGTEGASDHNVGKLQVRADMEVTFDDEDIMQAITDNETVTMDFILKSDDGGIAVDIPSMTLDGSNLSLPRNETVKISPTGAAFKDATLGYSIGISIFPALP